MKCMKLVGIAAAAAAFAVPMAANADPVAALDVYYIADSSYEVDTPIGDFDDDGDGFGGRVAFPLGDSGFGLHAEYQSATLDDSDIDLDQLRLGGSWMADGNIRFGVVGEYISFDDESNDSDGFGIHARGEFNISEPFLVYAQLGYVSISDSGEDADGLEYLIGGVFNITPMFGIGVDYRGTDLEADNDVDFTLEDLRVGVRINFGA